MWRYELYQVFGRQHSIDIKLTPYNNNAPESGDMVRLTLPVNKPDSTIPTKACDSMNIIQYNSS